MACGGYKDKGIMSAKQRKAISDAKKGKKLTAAQKKAISDGMKNCSKK